MVSQPSAGGITDAVPPGIATSLTASQIGITADDTLSARRALEPITE